MTAYFETPNFYVEWAGKPGVYLVVRRDDHYVMATYTNKSLGRSQAIKKAKKLEAENQ